MKKLVALLAASMLLTTGTQAQAPTTGGFAGMGAGAAFGVAGLTLAILGVVAIQNADDNAHSHGHSHSHS